MNCSFGSNSPVRVLPQCIAKFILGLSLSLPNPIPKPVPPQDVPTSKAWSKKAEVYPAPSTESTGLGRDRSIDPACTDLKTVGWLHKADEAVKERTHVLTTSHPPKENICKNRFFLFWFPGYRGQHRG